MLLKELYDRCNGISPISQNDFVSAVNETIDRLVAKYGARAVFKKGERATITRYDDECAVFDEYMPVLKDGILYIKTKDSDRKKAYEESADYAYRTVWAEKIRRRRYRTPSWY